MKIIILTSSKHHPIYPLLKNWKNEQSKVHDVILTTKIPSKPKGDFLFLISYLSLLKKEIRENFKHVLVIHASDLPKGRGWSPHVWTILKGQNKITVSLLEAEDKVDSGNIWKKSHLKLEGHELYDEINKKLFQTILKLMDFAIDNFKHVKPLKQPEKNISYYKRRTPENSELDPKKSIAEQFDLLRVSDPNRFPCYFYLRGKKFQLSIKKI